MEKICGILNKSILLNLVKADEVDPVLIRRPPRCADEDSEMWWKAPVKASTGSGP